MSCLWHISLIGRVRANDVCFDFCHPGYIMLVRLIHNPFRHAKEERVLLPRIRYAGKPMPLSRAKLQAFAICGPGPSALPASGEGAFAIVQAVPLSTDTLGISLQRVTWPG